MNDPNVIPDLFKEMPKYFTSLTMKVSFYTRLYAILSSLEYSNHSQHVYISVYRGIRTLDNA